MPNWEATYYERRDGKLDVVRETFSGTMTAATKAARASAKQSGRRLVAVYPKNPLQPGAIGFDYLNQAWMQGYSQLPRVDLSDWFTTEAEAPLERAPNRVELRTADDYYGFELFSYDTPEEAAAGNDRIRWICAEAEAVDGIERRVELFTEAVSHE